MIFANYSFKKKFFALLVIFALLSVTAYKRSFSGLIDAVGEHRSLNQKFKMINAKSTDVESLRREIASLDKLIGHEGTSKEKIQQEMLSFVAQSQYKATIFDLRAVHEFTDNNYRIYTSQIDLTGPYNMLLQLSYDFEKNFRYSRLVNLNFYTIKKNNNPDVLHLKMTFQNYENIR